MFKAIITRKLVHSVLFCTEGNYSLEWCFGTHYSLSKSINLSTIMHVPLLLLLTGFLSAIFTLLPIDAAEVVYLVLSTITEKVIVYARYYT